MTALTSSFASSKDQNPITEDVTYYGAIEEIIKLDFGSQFTVVLFRLDWFHAEIDEFGLVRVQFKKLLYKDDPYVLPYQVHQVFYVPDPIEIDIFYAMKRIPRDLFDFLQVENLESYWREPVDVDYNVPGTSNGNGSWVREGENVRVVNIDNVLQNDQNVDEEVDDLDFDDTDWDWMHATT